MFLGYCFVFLFKTKSLNTALAVLELKEINLPLFLEFWD